MDNKENVILSVIIPVYNVEKYIYKCLNSIYSQDFPHDKVEIIVVNDGTPDKSIDKIDVFIKQYDNLTIINQANQGLSMARNNGLAKAVGRYVWFVDSDDWLQNNSLNIILSCISLYDIDMISTKLIRVSEKNGRAQTDRRSKYINGKKLLKGKDFLFDEGCYAPVQQFIYKREFLLINNLQFYPKIHHEDAQFNFRALYLCNDLYLLDEPVYNYLLRGSGSIMSSISVTNGEDLVLIHKTLYEFGNKYVTKQDLKEWRAVISGMLFTIFFLVISFS